MYKYFFSVYFRRLDLLSFISDDTAINKPTIIFTGRVHPGETPSSYVIKGIIETLAGNDRLGKEFKNYFNVFVVPMLNPDGVFLGNYRSNIFG